MTPAQKMIRSGRREQEARMKAEDFLGSFVIMLSCLLLAAVIFAIEFFKSALPALRILVVYVNVRKIMHPYFF